ncbi:hypothetical protein M9434_004428 [Picochlorum sp. BPE23]|nr:hypothetical protein M9434_004428 [Picochlorum sp. BPE23]
MHRYLSVHFTVHGRVQGVFFRAYTRDKATSLGLVGYCRNTPEGTVQGVIQGVQESVESMKQWLRTEGSPHSSISDCEFAQEETVTSLDYSTFDVRR